MIVDPVTSIVYHIEDRASESGRAVLVQTHTNKDVVGKTWNVRSAVHEYGGAAAIVYNDIAYFSHVVDGKLYEVNVNGGEPVPVTPGMFSTLVNAHELMGMRRQTIPVC